MHALDHGIMGDDERLAAKFEDSGIVLQGRARRDGGAGRAGRR